MGIRASKFMCEHFSILKINSLGVISTEIKKLTEYGEEEETHQMHNR